MAIKQKTITFAWDMRTADSDRITIYTLPQQTLYLPEDSKTFVSAFVELGWTDAITATGGTITEHRVYLRLGSNGYSQITETDDVTNTGENMGGIFGPFDYTSYFNTNWTGSSMTCDIQFFFDLTTGSNQIWRNVTALLHITYDYDDTSATQVKTVIVPFDSPAGSLSTTANASFDTIPQLTGVGGILPENSPVIRDYFIMIEGNLVAANANTDYTITANIDSGTSFDFGTEENALASDRYGRRIYKPSLPDTTSTHDFQLWASIASRANHLAAFLFVTYEFTLSGTSRTIRTALLPLEMDSPMGMANVEAEASRFKREFLLSDPGTITLRQSAYRINWNMAGSVSSIKTRAGSQAFRTYATSASVVVGGFSLQQRIDSSGVQGAGITLARGINTITIDAYAQHATTEATNINGYIILNYECDVAAEGIGSNTHTVFQKVLDWNAALSDTNRIPSFAFDIPETNHYLSSIGFCFVQWVSTSSQAVTFDAQLQSGEGKGAGYESIYADAYASDAERSCTVIWMRGRDAYKRFPQDADSNRIDAMTARIYRLYTTTTCGNGIFGVLTYHSMTWTLSGTLTPNPGAGETVNLYRADTMEKLQTTTTDSGGAYSFTVYNDVLEYYTDSYVDASNFGRSKSGTPDTDFDIALQATGGGGASEHAHVFIG